MDESVAFIFKTLIKVPCIIFVAFFIFNIFAFFFIYFKVLGLSYVLMQEVVANNYITTEQYESIWNSSLSVLADTELVNDIGVIIGKDANDSIVYTNSDTVAGITEDTMLEAVSGYSDIPGKCEVKTSGEYSTCVDNRVQYGQTRLVGIYCRYQIVWPLSYNKSMDLDDGVDGVVDNDLYEDLITTNYDSDADPYDGRDTGIAINISYEVPGLKYYSDLD